MNQNNDLALLRKTVVICSECLELDRSMLSKLGPLDDDRGRDPDNYVDPGLWEQFINARKELVDFTTSSIDVLNSGQKNNPNNNEPGLDQRTEEDEKNFAEQSELEYRLMTSLKEMVDLENKLANYLTENLSVLKETIDGLNKNQLLFTCYAKNHNKPDPGYLNSEV
jgi:hypothetical protein